LILPEWLKNQGWTNLQLANAIGVSEECARLYRAGLRRPGPEVVKRILRVTKGAVRQDDLLKAYAIATAKLPPYPTEGTPHGKLGRL